MLHPGSFMSGGGSPPGFGMQQALPGGWLGRLPGVITSVGDLLRDTSQNGDKSLSDLFCYYFPNLCNIGVPGAPYPTPDPRTPAPPPQPGPRYEGVPCPSGWHLNKGTYWTKAGVVHKGTRCVKNRRMNPTNARALGRAIRRGDSFVRLAKGFGMTAPSKGLKKRRCR